MKTLDLFKNCLMDVRFKILKQRKKKYLFPDLKISMLIGHIWECHSGRNISENTHLPAGYI